MKVSDRGCFFNSPVPAGTYKGGGKKKKLNKLYVITPGFVWTGLCFAKTTVMFC